MLDYNRLDEIKWLLDSDMEVGNIEVVFRKDKSKYKFERWTRENEDNTKIETDDWEIFKKCVADHFLGVDSNEN